jgi:hypothetical protein
VWWSSGAGYYNVAGTPTSSVTASNVPLGDAALEQRAGRLQKSMGAWRAGLCRMQSFRRVGNEVVAAKESIQTVELGRGLFPLIALWPICRGSHMRAEQHRDGY